MDPAAEEALLRQISDIDRDFREVDPRNRLRTEALIEIYERKAKQRSIEKAK